MSDFLNDFNVDEYKSDDFSPLPAGTYKIAITSSEVKQSSKGGQFLNLKTQVLDGEYKNRIIFANLNIVNANDQAQKIARVALADICRAVGVMHPKSYTELHNRPILAQVTVRPESENYPASNDIKRWMPVSEGAPVQVSFNKVSTEGNKKPWEK